MKKAIVLLACLLVSVCAFGADWQSDAPKDSVLLPVPNTESGIICIAAGSYGTPCVTSIPGALLMYNTLDGSFSKWSMRCPPASIEVTFTGADLTHVFADILPSPITQFDANIDGVLDERDLLFIRHYLGQSTTDTNIGADINCNGRIDILDLILLRNAL